MVPDHLSKDIAVPPNCQRLRIGATHLQVALSSLDPTQFRRIAGIIAAFRPDVIHFPLSHLWNPVIAYLFRHTPLVFTVHDPDPHEGARYVPLTTVCHRYLYSVASRIICLTEHSRLSVAARHPDYDRRAITIPHPSLTHYCQFLDTRSTPERDTVLFFGRIEPYKGLHVFVDAVERSARLYPNVRFVIAGAGKVPSFVRGRPGFQKVHLINRYISDQEVAALVSRSIVTVLPYTSATQSGVIAVAYALGCPVIASSVGGLPEMVDDEESGLLVPPSDCDALASAICRILADSALQRRLHQGATQCAAKRLSWKAVISEHMRVYEELLHGVVVPSQGAASVKQ